MGERRVEGVLILINAERRIMEQLAQRLDIEKVLHVIVDSMMLSEFGAYLAVGEAVNVQDQDAARLEDTPHFVDRGLRIVEVLKRADADHFVEGAVGKGQRLG